jgi:hypothetical protein
MPAKLNDLTAILALCDPKGEAAQIVVELCTNGGYLLASHTASSAWKTLANAPEFRELNFCIKQVNGDRFKVKPYEIVAEVAARATSEADIGTPRYFNAVREVFIMADPLYTLQAAASLLGWVAAEGPTEKDLQDFTRAYLTAALWASVPLGEPDSEGDATLDRLGYEVENCCAETKAKARADCEAFARDHYGLLQEAFRPRYGWAEAGHDFFLSRNGHGAGFFDRRDRPCWRALQRAAKAWGSTDNVTENDDGTCTVL